MRQSVAGDVRSTDARAGRGAPDRGDPAAAGDVRARAQRTACAFTLLVPRRCWDPDTEEAAATLELAIPLLEEAAGGHVEGRVGDGGTFVAVQHTLIRGSYDEIIISTLAARVSQRLRRDLRHRVEAPGLPVTVVTAKVPERASAPASGR